MLWSVAPSLPIERKQRMTRIELLSYAHEHGLDVMDMDHMCVVMLKNELTNMKEGIEE